MARTATSNLNCTIGIDVGGTKTAGAIVLPDEGTVVLHRTIPTLAARGGVAVADDTWQLADELIRLAADKGLLPRAMGIAICELVDTEGNLASDETIAWRGFPVRERFDQLLPTVFEADSRAAALAEARFGAGRTFPIFLYVTIGTGISCSLVIGGRPYCGARGSTGTLASGPLSTLCGQCGQMTHSVLEQIASGSALGQRYAASRGRKSLTAVRAQDVILAADQGDPTARDIVESAAHCVGSLIALLVSVLDPHAVVIGGGLGSAPGRYFQTLTTTAKSQIWSETHRDLPIVQGVLGELAAAIGAAAAQTKEE